MYNVVQKKIYDFFPQDREINEPMKRYYIHVCDFLFGKYFFFLDIYNKGKIISMCKASLQ